MKKLMMTTVAALGFAVCAKAADDGVLNSTGFEDYGDNKFDVGTSDSGSPDSGTQYWTGTGDFEQTVLKTYAEAEIKAPANVPDAFKAAASNKTFLSVDTGSDVMYRKAGSEAGSVDLTQGAVFFDANVKFTASETDVVPSEGDKLLVWLKGDENSQTTNLVVTAGLYNKSTEEYDQTNFTVVGDYAADTWYRLTVKAEVENEVTTFIVYIDGEQVSATYEDGVFGSFPSLVESGSDSGKLIEAAGFQGTGALDNVVWTKTDPFYVETEEFTVNVTLAQTIVTDGVEDMINGWTLNGEECSENTGARGTVVVGENAKIEVLLNIALPAKVTATVDDTVVADDNIVIEGNNDDGYTITIMIDGSSYKDGDKVEVTIALTETSGGEEVPTEGEAAAGGSATVKAADADAAVAAVTVTVDSEVAAALTAEQKAAFVASFFTKSVVDNQDGTFTVSVAVNGKAVEAKLDEVVAEALETAADGKITKIPAGLCYKIKSGSTVGLGTEAKGVSTGETIEVKGLTPEAGFYKVSLDVAPIK